MNTGLKEPRSGIPKAIKEQVLREFSSLCGLCGMANPQLHHINENPGDNDPLNLIPLCPNCHHAGQHHPTRRIDPTILRLFREYKHDAILNPKFKGLLRRMEFLNKIDELGLDRLTTERDDLIAFVKEMDMGEFYAKKLDRILPSGRYVTIINETYDEQVSENTRDMRRRMRAVLEEVRATIMEAVSVRSWPRPEFG